MKAWNTTQEYLEEKESIHIVRIMVIYIENI